MKTSYKILKLRSGEEIITKIRGENNGKLILERPMVFKTVLVSSPYGTQKEITILKNWLSFTNEIETKIPKDFIATYLEPDHSVIKLYDLEKKKEDIDPPTPKKIIDARDLNKKSNKDKQPPSNKILKDIINNLSDEDMKEMFDDMMDENRFPDFPFPSKEEGENMIAFSMFLPPEALLSLVNAGLLDLEDVQNMIDAMTNHPKNDIKYTGDDENRKSSEDFGTKWTDWSPDPDDYL